MKDRPAFGACDRRLVEIEKPCAALLALMLVAELGFRHGPTSLSGEALLGRAANHKAAGPVSEGKRRCQMEVETATDLMTG
jgi:hypothetical protein